MSGVFFSLHRLSAGYGSSRRENDTFNQISALGFVTGRRPRFNEIHSYIPRLAGRQAGAMVGEGVFFST